MGMIFDILSRSLSLEKGPAYNPATSAATAYTRMLFDDSYARDAIYVIANPLATVAPACWTEYSHRVILICPGKNDENFKCALRILDDTSPLEVANAIEEGLTPYKEVFEKLSSLALDRHPPAVLIETAHRLLQNPVLVEDRAMRVVAHTHDDVMDDDYWTPLDAEIDLFKQQVVVHGLSEFLGEMESSREPFDYKMLNGVNLSACRTGELGGEYLYVYLLEKNRPITDGDRGILKFLTAMIELVVKMRTDNMGNSLGFSGLFINAIDGTTNRFAEFRNRMRVMGYELKPISRITVVTSIKGCLNDRQAARLLNDIANTFPFGKGVFYESRLVFYATYGTEPGVKQVDLDRFEGFLGRFCLVAAIGKPVQTGYPMQDLYQEALFTLDIGRRVFPGKHLHLFEACQPFWPFETCLRTGTPNLYYHPALSLITAYDNRKGTSLYEALRTLAMQRGNKSRTSKLLYMQRNTLQSRIKEIESICNVDLSDPGTISHIRSSFCLHDYCNGNPDQWAEQ